MSDLTAEIITLTSEAIRSLSRAVPPVEVSQVFVTLEGKLRDLDREALDLVAAAINVDNPRYPAIQVWGAGTSGAPGIDRDKSIHMYCIDNDLLIVHLVKADSGPDRGPDEE